MSGIKRIAVDRSGCQFESPVVNPVPNNPQAAAKKESRLGGVVNLLCIFIYLYHLSQYS